jgi:hypothetical protein
MSTKSLGLVGCDTDENRSEPVNTAIPPHEREADLTEECNLSVRIRCGASLAYFTPVR